MFNNTKFKKGDTVSLKSDLTTQLSVEKVWIETTNHVVYTSEVEMIALSNNTVVTSNDINYYSYPINKLANIQKEDYKKLSEAILKISKELEEIKNKVIKKQSSYDFFSTYAESIAGIWGGGRIKTEDKEEVKTLEERIEELETKLNKKIKTTKKVKKLIKTKQ